MSNAVSYFRMRHEGHKVVSRIQVEAGRSAERGFKLVQTGRRKTTNNSVDSTTHQVTYLSL